MKKALALFFSLLLLVVSLSPAALAEPEEAAAPVAIRGVDKNTLSIIGRQLTVRLESQNGNHSLNGLEVKASAGGAALTAKAGEDGTVTFTIPEGTQEVTVSTEEQEINGVTFTAMEPETVPFFEELSRTFNGDTGILTVKLSGNRWKVSQIRVDDTIKKITSSSDGFSANLGDNISPQTHSLAYEVNKYVIRVAPLTWTEGTLDVNIDADYDDGIITVKLTDKKWNYPLAGLEVIVRIGSTDLHKGTTGEDGVIAFRQSVSDLATVQIVVENQTDKNNPSIKYSGAMKGLQEIDPPTTDDPTTTTTTNNTTNTTSPSDSTTPPTSEDTTETTQTQATITGAGTTAIGDDGMISLNVTYENVVLGNFGLTQADFAERARLIITPAMFESLVGTSGGSVMMLMRHANSSIQPQMITQAIAGNDTYASYDVDKVTYTTFSLSLVLNDPRVGEVIFPAVNQTENVQYTIQLPVPASMQNADIISVAVYGENGLSNLTQTEVKDGYIRFTTNNLSTFTLLGFIPSSAFRSSGIPAVVIIMMVIAVVLLIGAGLLIFFFVIRKPKDGDGTPPTDDGENDGDNDGNHPGPDDGTPTPGGGDGVTAVPLYNPSAQDDGTPVSRKTPAPVQVPVEEESRDIYSSAARMPSAPREIAQDVSLGSFLQEDAKH